MHVYGQITATLSSKGTVTGALSSPIGLSASLTIPSVANAPRYDGDYTFTPTQTEQTIQIKDLMAREDITIEAIPNNYGLITYNGSTITVS